MVEKSTVDTGVKFVNVDEVRFETAAGRRYRHPNRKLGYPSVTTIIGKAWPHDYLEVWKMKNLAKTLIKNSDEVIERLQTIKERPQRIQDLSHEGLSALLIEWREDYSAADRGTRIHEGLEVLLRGEMTAKKLRKQMEPEEYAQVITAVHKLEEIHFQPTHIEVPVYGHDPVKYAGTADLIGEFSKHVRGKMRRYRAVIDLKTGRRVYKDYAAQLAAYARAQEILNSEGELEVMPEIKTALVLHVVAGAANLYRVDIEKGWDDFAACAHIFYSSNSEGGLTEYG